MCPPETLGVPQAIQNRYPNYDHPRDADPSALYHEYWSPNCMWPVYTFPNGLIIRKGVNEISTVLKLPDSMLIVEGKIRVIPQLLIVRDHAFPNTQYLEVDPNDRRWINANQEYEDSIFEENDSCAIMGIWGTSYVVLPSFTVDENDKLQRLRDEIGPMNENDPKTKSYVANRFEEIHGLDTGVPTVSLPHIFERHLYPDYY